MDNEFFAFPGTTSSKSLIRKNLLPSSVNINFDEYISVCERGRTQEDHQREYGIKLNYYLENCRVDLLLTFSVENKQNPQKTYNYFVGLERKMRDRSSSQKKEPLIYLNHPYNFGNVKGDGNLITAQISLCLKSLSKREEIGIALKLFELPTHERLPSIKQIQNNNELPMNPSTVKTDIVPGEKEEIECSIEISQWNIAINGDVYFE